MSSSNNPSGRPKGALNKKRQHFFDLAEKHKFDVVEFLMLVAAGKSRELGLFNPNDLDEEGEIASVIIPMEMRFDAAKSLLPYLYAKPRAPENEDENEKGNVMRLAYKLEEAPKLEGPEDE